MPLPHGHGGAGGAPEEAVPLDSAGCSSPDFLGGAGVQVPFLPFPVEVELGPLHAGSLTKPTLAGGRIWAPAGGRGVFSLEMSLQVPREERRTAVAATSSPQPSRSAAPAAPADEGGRMAHLAAGRRSPGRASGHAGCWAGRGPPRSWLRPVFGVRAAQMPTGWVAFGALTHLAPSGE